MQLQISAQLDMALEHHNAMRLGEAEYIYRQILKAQPNNADATHLLGLLGHQIGKHEEAIELMSKAIALKPSFAEAYSNLGLAKQALGKTEDARKHFQKAIAQDANLVVAHNNYGNLLCNQDKNYTEAVACFKKVIQLDPNFTLGYINYGNALKAQKKYSEAVSVYKKALSIEPNSDLAHHNLAMALLDIWSIDEAITHYKAAQDLNPNTAKPKHDMLVVLQYSANIEETEIQETCDAFSTHHESPLISEWGGYKNTLNTKRRLKIGYVSPDLRVHPIANFIEPVLSQHNHQQFEIYCYFNNLHQDHVTSRIKNLVDHWLDCPMLLDEDFAKQIRADEIDILIDLSGHTFGNRLLAFARKPAPIQVSWMGYVGSTGLKSIDYRLTDINVEPSGEGSLQTVEKPWLLDPVWYVYRPCIKQPELRSSPDMQVKILPALKNGHITFGCFNNTSKITAKVIRLWSRILESIPSAMLTLVTNDNDFVKSKILAEFSQHGIAKDKLKFLPFAQDNHYLLYHQIDIALDPFPYSGGTTTCDGLWMGVPFITLAGKVFRSRMGVTIAQNVGHAEWIAKDEAEYVQKACALGANIPKLNELRLGLRGEMENCPLMDEVGFTKKLEAAYREMWVNYCEENAKK
jgi:predicted O-linked N-acetylglucosamine transferase (SPINDLY family)